MIIDFHAHTFPDAIAEKTISFLADRAGIPPHREGTLSALRESMKNNNIDVSVVLPVATNPKQVSTINRLSFEENGKDGVVFFGAIHPDCENIEEILDEIKSHGILGIKIHPDYQGYDFDDERYVRIMREAAKRDLITVTHAGVDLGCGEPVRCTPEKVLSALKKIGSVIENKLCLAHLGGADMPDEVLEKLCGKPIFFDTSFVLDRYPEKAKEIIIKHGFDKILFATDSPWSGQGEFRKIINSFGFSPEDTEKIFSGNARRLLNM